MKRSFVFSVFAVVLTVLFSSVAVANTVNVSLDIFYTDSADADLFVDAAGGGSWQLYATADEEGLAALATQLTGIGGLDALTNRPVFRANLSIDAAPAFDTFKETFDDGGTPKPWDTDSDGDSATLEMVFGQVPVASPGPQELTYNVGQVGGATLNVDELGVSVDVSGASMTDAILLAFGTFDAGGAPVINAALTATDANLFSVIPGSPGVDPPAVGTILQASLGTLGIQTRTNLGAGAVRAGDISLDGPVNAIDAGAMFGNWDGGAAAIFTWQEGDLSGDGFINAVDAGAMFGSWTGDPGPAGVGTAIAEYDFATGEITVSIDGVNNWFVQSASLGLTGDAPVGLPIVPGSLASDNDEIIGETAFGLGSGTDVSLGLVAQAGLPLGDLTISSNAGLGAGLVTLDVVYVNVPEPATLALAAFGLCGVLATRRRRVA